MDRQLMTDKHFSEFSYSEDVQVALNDALYANDFSLDGVKEKIVDNTVRLLFVPFFAFASPSKAVYAETNLPRTEQRDARQAIGDFKPTANPIINDVTIVEESSYKKMISFVRNLSTLPKDLPGLDFEVPSKEVTENAMHFLSAMEAMGLECPEHGAVMPSVFGTIVIDAVVDRGLVSIEIGRTKVGFFTDYEDGINEESDGIATDFRSIPEVLLNHLGV